MARRVNRLSPFNVTSLALGLAFLYLPIVILVIYSFNDSRLVTVWGGWSLRWYREFFNDRAMLDAAWMSLRVAAVSATIATLLGTLAAVGWCAASDSGGGRCCQACSMRRWCGGGDLGTFVAVAVRGAERRAWLLDRNHRAHHADDVLRHRGGAVAPCLAGPQP